MPPPWPRLKVVTLPGKNSPTQKPAQTFASSPSAGEEFFGERSIDLMATAENTICKEFFALSCVESSRGQNAFRYNWG
jgi:hypothetical protein